MAVVSIDPQLPVVKRICPERTPEWFIASFGRLWYIIKVQVICSHQEIATIIRKALTFRLFLMVLLVGAVFAGCGGDGPTEPQGDTTPPTVVSTDPADGTSDIPADKVIRVTFSEPVNAATVSSSAFTVAGVSGTLNVNGAVVSFSPTTPMAYSTSYTATITTIVTDTAGNHLGSNFSWSFTTETDPDSLPPMVVSTDPTVSQQNVPVGAAVSVTFSKPIDSATVSSVTFGINNGVTGAYTFNGPTVTLTPTSPLQYNTTYTASVGTGVADTFGLHLQSRYSWTFTTSKDPNAPTAAITAPFNGAIVGDTIAVTATAAAFGGALIDSVVLYVDGSAVVSDNAAPYTFDYDATSFVVASLHDIYVRAWDDSGRVVTSSAAGVFYQWMEEKRDGNEDTLQNIRRLLWRSTDSILELRYEFSKTFQYNPYTDTALNLSVFFDTDLDPGTGKNTFDFNPLNDIGADYRVIIGLKDREDTALARYDNALDPPWEPIFDTSGFTYINQPVDQKILEFGLKWSDLGTPDSLRIVSINVFFYDTLTFAADWVPDIGDGYVTLPRLNLYVGPTISGSPSLVPYEPAIIRPSKPVVNPFNR